MQCDVCGNKKATVHLTEIVDEQMTELHLCEDCARQKSVQMEQQFGLADLLAGLADFGQQVKNVEKIKLQCSNCSMTYDDFRKFGRLGCSECYNAFREQLAVLLKKIHGSNQHLGKAPSKLPQPIKKKIDQLQELKRQLQRAIEAESFEEAAALRDKIRGLEKKGEG
ncbi:MAG: hypothetical protein A2787_07995 [Omnitrophica WOR_2 bacterium RIFCSPHIGHO2_01_FULL_48_9]|nr:MAG: hypothetical protein A3D10_02555 [Omnitrophica WOR_2 bacterium RIFCSPHIGHO2_02_FULL_48_11]OGX33783.1 MAG: hypothetical protein A2787_07995 [Omnitrophica WOR_2 bacterium RIFCSPHIGHO2_01_FULL_48_9]